jgi:hypothetical protein
MAKKTSKKSAPAAREPGAPEVSGSEEDYQRFLPAARALDVRDVVPFRADASLAYHNVMRGVEAVLAREADLRRELPALDVAQVRDLPKLALGVAFAASQVDRSSPSPRTTGKLLAEARPLRELLLTSAEALARAGLVPAREVEKIREGKGPIDTATDLVDLAALYRKHAARVRGKSPVDAASIQRASALGTELLAVLKPMSAPRTRTVAPEVAQAVEARDRLWTLTVTRHALLRRAGGWLFGDRLDDHVPPLQSRVRVTRSKPPATPPPPAAG